MIFVIIVLAFFCIYGYLLYIKKKETAKINEQKIVAEKQRLQKLQREYDEHLALYANQINILVYNTLTFKKKYCSNKTIKNLNSCDINNLEEERKRSEIGNNTKRLVGVEGGNYYLKDIKQILENEETDINKLKCAFENLQSIISVSENDSIFDLNELSKTLGENIYSLRKEQKVQFEFEQAKKEVNEATAIISKNAKLLDKYKHAVDTLKSLTGNEASTHVTEFFQENFQEVFDIFKSIHVPREFKTLRYSNRLELITDDDARLTTQISTGQRSALALSIFLSLNSKLKDGPNIIMFDDPVAFIDDLNALSFLDYLRLHILKAGKQIFFATANMRLAGLFEKKFGFLKENFRFIELTRSPLSIEE